MVYVLVLLALMHNGDIRRQTVVFPDEALCIAASNGIAAEMQAQKQDMIEAGIVGVKLGCVPAREA